ncbi:DUF7738 domain-containing protein [Arenibacter algicola]|uniref:DUF7738 domain-containing protein n=1 Tax=Arenibacter algicola TaxID=616991 RepID=UPI0004DF71A3|nr:hypothetical protein [Arenibacter algicola]
MGLFDFRDLSKRKKKGTITIECEPDGVRINSSSISFPTSYKTLKNILGDATRVEPINQTNSKVYLWDELGIYCSSADPDKMLMLLLVEDNRYGLGHQPKNNFTGTVLIDGEAMDISLEKVSNDRPYIIRSVIKEKKQVAIALGWNPGI